MIGNLSLEKKEVGGETFGACPAYRLGPSCVLCFTVIVREREFIASGLGFVYHLLSK